MLSETRIRTLERRRAQVLSEVASVGEMRAGSLTARFRRCGKANCRCARPDDPGHGPVLSLTRNENGKTVTRIIPAHAEADTRARIAEYRRFRRLSKELVAVSTALSEARLAAGCEQTAGTVKKGASRKRSRTRSARRSTRS